MRRNKKSIIVDKSYTEESESQCAYKSINKEKDANNEADYYEPFVTDNTVVK